VVEGLVGEVTGWVSELAGKTGVVMPFSRSDRPVRVSPTHLGSSIGSVVKDQ